MEKKPTLFTILQRFSWSAIFAGVFAGFGINFLFNLFVLAFGISVFALTSAGDMSFSWLGFIAYALVAIITMFITGYVAGRLTPPTFMTTMWGFLIGFIAWSILLIVTVIVITNMIQFVAFHSNFTSHPNLVAIRITNENPMLTETRSGTQLREPLDINIEKTTKIISLNALVTFILFLIGAFSGGLGGYLGYQKTQRQFRYISRDRE